MFMKMTESDISLHRGGVGDLYFRLDRPVGSGAAWRRSPHQNSAGREREKRKRREGRKEREKRGEGEEREREREEKKEKRERERERERLREKQTEGNGDTKAVFTKLRITYEEMVNAKP